MRIATFAAAAGLALGLTACMKNSYTTGLPEGGAVHTEKAQFFLWGLVGDKDVYLNKLCPEGVASFQNRMGFMDGCLYGCTGGIYAPRTIEVKCSGGTAWQLTPMPEQNGTLVEAL